MASDDDPIFLQIKEAKTSVLEPYVGKSLHKNNGERIVAGQRLMQSASDRFLGWYRGEGARVYYIRQLRDTKITAIIEGWDFKILRAVWETVCVGLGARACPIGRRRENCGLHGF